MKLLLLLVSVPFVTAWVQLRANTGTAFRRKCSHLRSSPAESAATSVYEPVFDFSKPETVDMIGRLDDAIMGGISTSSVVPSNDTESNNNFAKWLGVCRTDGGGFCGFRTNPFREPLHVADADGFYLVGRLVSDLQPERRVWKFSTRTNPGRGEKVYQAPFSFPKNQTWHRVHIPFADFRLVQGPRIVPDGPPLNTTGGIYQVGMTMSKFVFGANATELNSFRDGFFEVHFKEIGFYRQQSSSQELAVGLPQILSESEAKKQRPVVFKIISPFFPLLFSESRYAVLVFSKRVAGLVH